MQTSVLVVSYNVRDCLARCLESVSDAYQVVVVDNASRDGSADMVRRDFPDVQLITHDENLGFSVGVNRAAEAADGEALLLLNPDARIAPGGLTRMSQALSRRPPDVWAVGFRQVDDEGVFQLAMGPPPSLSLDLVRKFVQRRLDRGDLLLARLIDRLLWRPMPVPWVAGSALLVRRDAFERVGGFDEEFFLFFEDIDFCLRLRQAGGRVIYDPEVTVVHERGRSADRDPFLARRAYRRSQLRFWEKHRGGWARDVVGVYQRVRGVALPPE